MAIASSDERPGGPHFQRAADPFGPAVMRSVREQARYFMRDALHVARAVPTISRDAPPWWARVRPRPSIHGARRRFALPLDCRALP
ncbi:hypothetical protein BRAO375_1030006 [Bradyrhizobium sp. ORS 375]|nr:hypothetical protein BRAO375_1030006 [Bradyrhizobium sp. ORS 375]